MPKVTPEKFYGKLQKNLDIDRYMGTWYEIAKYPTPFQIGCSRSVAIYEKLMYTPDNSPIETRSSNHDIENIPILFSVLNKCIDDGGNVIRSINGIGEIPDKDTPAAIKVSFDITGAENIQPITGPNYLIHYTNYKYAIVGSPDKSTLFILARTPYIPVCVYNDLKKKVEKFGYSSGRLVIDTGAVVADDSDFNRAHRIGGYGRANRYNQRDRWVEKYIYFIFVLILFLASFFVVSSILRE